MVENEMPLKLNIVWSLLLIAMPCESFAQGLPPETRRRETVANQREDARNWDATAKEYLRELEAATVISSNDQRAVVYRIHLRLASLYETHYQYSEAEQYYERAGKCSQRSFWRTEWGACGSSQPRR